MDDLTTTSFNDKQILKILNYIIQGKEGFSVISTDEKDLVNRRDDIIALYNKSLNQDPPIYLMTELEKLRYFVPVYDNLFFLLEADKLNKLDEAFDALETVLTEERSMSLNNFMKILYDKDTETPLSWKIIMMGEDQQRFDNTSPKKKSSIDINLFKDFK